MTRLIHIPKIQIAFFLFLIFLTNVIHAPSLRLVFILLISLSSTLLSDFLFTNFRKTPRFLESAALVSGLIITLSMASNSPWYEFVIAGVLAMASKNFLRISNQHIFNPAAFGLFFMALIFGQTISWWGVSWQQFSIYFIVLLLPFFVSAYRIKRYFMQISFLAVYIIVNKIFNFQFSIFNFFDPTVLFFLSVMLPEPMTSPSRSTQQILFGISVALVSVSVSTPIFNFISDPLILSLLLCNLLFKIKLFRPKPV